MSVFGQLKDERKAEQEKLLAEYFAFLARLNVSHSTEGERDKLARYLKQLGRSVEQGERDYIAIGEVQATMQAIEATADSNRLHGEAAEAHERACRERQETTLALNENVRLTFNDLTAAADAMDRHQQARRRLAELKLANPVLFAAVAEASLNTKKQKR